MNLQLGRMNRLTVARSTEQGLYLSGGPEDILLPNRYIPEGIAIGDELDVFLYLAFLTQSSRIDEHELHAEGLVFGIVAVACGTSDVGDDMSVCAQKRVD